VDFFFFFSVSFPLQQQKKQRSEIIIPSFSLSFFFLEAFLSFGPFSLFRTQLLLRSFCLYRNQEQRNTRKDGLRSSTIIVDDAISGRLHDRAGGRRRLHPPPPGSVGARRPRRGPGDAAGRARAGGQDDAADGEGEEGVQAGKVLIRSMSRNTLMAASKIVLPITHPSPFLLHLFSHPSGRRRPRREDRGRGAPGRGAEPDADRGGEKSKKFVASFLSFASLFLFLSFLSSSLSQPQPPLQKTTTGPHQAPLRGRAQGQGARGAHQEVQDQDEQRAGAAAAAGGEWRWRRRRWGAAGHSRLKIFPVFIFFLRFRFRFRTAAFVIQSHPQLFLSPAPKFSLCFSS